jgi:hypothetical protein
MLNTPQGKGKQVVDHGEGTSSHFKKKKKNDKSRRDANLVAAVERKTSRPKGNPIKPMPSKDHFERLLDKPCPHHEVPVRHSLKDCRLIKNYVNDTLKSRTTYHPKKGGPPCQRRQRGGCVPGQRWCGAHDLQGISAGKTLEAAREAHPVRSLQRRHREAILSKVVGGFDNLRPQGPSRPCGSSRILPTSGSSPDQIQKGPQGPDGWGKRDQHALCVYS